MPVVKVDSLVNPPGECRCSHGRLWVDRGASYILRQREGEKEGEEQEREGERERERERVSRGLSVKTFLSQADRERGRERLESKSIRGSSSKGPIDASWTSHGFTLMMMIDDDDLHVYDPKIRCVTR